MVVGVRHDDPVRVADGHVVRVLQVTGLRTHLTELAHEGTVRLENLGNKSDKF